MLEMENKVKKELEEAATATAREAYNGNFDELQGNDRRTLIETQKTILCIRQLASNAEYIKILTDDLPAAMEVGYDVNSINTLKSELLTTYRYFKDYHTRLTLESPSPSGAESQRVPVHTGVIQIYYKPLEEATTFATTEGVLLPGNMENPFIIVNSDQNLSVTYNRDRMLLTLTHEYFHALQRLKRNRYLSNFKFDEATATFVEFRAY